MNSLAIATLTSAVRATVQRIQAEAPDTDAAELLRIIEADLSEWDTIMTALCRAAGEATAAEEAIAERMNELGKRCARFSAQREAYRALIFAALDAAGQTKWKSPEFTVSITPGRAGVVITDPAAIPDAFVRIKREPDKTAIGSALAGGAEIPGADLRNGAPSLVIRSK